MITTETRKKIIISADDFGISKLANANIFRLIKTGKLDRIEIMVSENLNADEIEELKNSHIKLDIHLHLVNYNSDYWRGNRRLKEGVLKRIFLFFWKYATRKTSPEKVELQWAIQIEKFKEIFGRTPDGISAHEYIHYFPPYLKTVIHLSEKYEIPFIRFGRKNFDCENSIAKVLNWLRKKGLLQIEKTNLNTSDFLVSFDWFDKLDFISNLPPETQTEIVFHPEREEELKFLEEL
ncbi:MAG TPA: hypothetical protein DCS28_00750 [Candidatus Moranbacteria bacterium]|nr:hypothetical protein [Candidatus Moranbacteria bacterium]HAT74557.1 hypothetical protein [Candidatus Moranbacteria bacterium]